MSSSRTPTNELKKLALSGKDDMPVQTRAMSQKQMAAASSSRQQRSAGPSTAGGSPQERARRPDDDDDDDDSDDSDDDSSDDSDAGAGAARPATDPRLERVREVIQTISIFDPSGLSGAELYNVIQTNSSASRDPLGKLYTDFVKLITNRAANDPAFVAQLRQTVPLASDDWCKALTHQLAKRIRSVFEDLDRNEHNTDFVVKTSRQLWSINNAIGTVFREHPRINRDNKRSMLSLLFVMLNGAINRDRSPAELRVAYAGELPQHTNLYTNLLRTTPTTSGLNSLFVLGTLDDLTPDTLALTLNDLTSVYTRLSTKEMTESAGGARAWKDSAPKYFITALHELRTRASRSPA